MEGFIFIFFFSSIFFVFSPLSEGKMDWGLFLHCAALTFTLSRALRSGECRGDGGSAWGAAPGAEGAQRGRSDPRPPPGNFPPGDGSGAVLPRYLRAGHCLLCSVGCLYRAGCSFSQDQDSQLS